MTDGVGTVFESEIETDKEIDLEGSTSEKAQICYKNY